MANYTWVLLLFLFLVGTRAYKQDTYTAFVRCMQKNTAVEDNIGSLIFYSSNSSYSSVLSAYIRNKRFDTASTSKPLLIVTANNVQHVKATVLCTQRTAPGYTLKIRSGGHDYDGLSSTSTSPFLILDMFNLRTITAALATKTAWIQAGALLGEVYYAIANTSNLLGFPGGVCPTVGIGGTISSGGYGNMMRKYGLSVDNVLDALVVDAKGRLLNRSTMGEDFFWALRGGGGASFGVVVAYKVNLLPVPATVTVFKIKQYADENAANMLFEWQKVAPTISDDLFMRVILTHTTSRKDPGVETIMVSVMALYLGGADTLVNLVESQFPSLGLKKSDCKELSWIQSVLWWTDLDPNQNPTVLLNRTYSSHYLKRKSDYVEEVISEDNLNGLFKKMVSVGKTEMVFNPYGGRISQISSSALPFAHRAGNLFMIQYREDWNDAGSVADTDNMRRIRELHSFMTPFVSKNPRRSFFPYRDIDIGVMPPGTNSLAVGRVYGKKYFNGNFDRLVKIKTAVDPTNFFHNEQSIPTLY